MGAGSWGTALALQLGRSHERVLLLDHNASRAVDMQKTRENQRYLPGVLFPETLTVLGLSRRG